MEKMRQGELGAETLKHTVLGNWGEGAEAAPVWLLSDSIPICGGDSAHTLIRRLNSNSFTCKFNTSAGEVISAAQLMSSNRSCRDQGNCRDLRSRNSSEFTVFHY